MTTGDHPSPVTQVPQPGASNTLWIPQNELFRVRNIFVEEEYGIPPQYLPSGRLTVVDIGANVGLFSLYIKAIRSDCQVYCFEPVPSSLDLLKKNTQDLENIAVFPYALSNYSGMKKLHLHATNSGENSLKGSSDNPGRTLPVEVVDASCAFGSIGLQYVDILKIDTEGSEVEILKSLQRYLPYVGIVMAEYHSETDRRRIDSLLGQHILFDAGICRPELGIVKYINSRLL